MTKKNLKKHENNWENIVLLADNNYTNKISLVITEQCLNTFHNNQSLLQQISPNIYMLSIKNSNEQSSLKLKKISDRIHYYTLPSIHNEDNFIKLNLHQIKNLCLHLDTPSWYQYRIDNSLFSHKINIFFYINKNKIIETITNLLKSNNLNNFEINNDTIIITNIFKYKINIQDIISKTLWENKTLKDTLSKEMNSLKTTLNFYEKIYSNLQKIFKNISWQLIDGEIKYIDDGLTKNLDYQNLAKDIVFCGYEDKIENYLKLLHIGDLDLSPWFATTNMRSLVYLKARPNVLSEKRMGFSICAAKEYLGKQTFIKEYEHNEQIIKFWKKRSERCLSSHNYKAKVVFHENSSKNAVALIGEQIASIALFPALIKGVLEKLLLDFRGKIKLIAHSEDILIIANKEASWVEINELNNKAFSLFTMISQDGADKIDFYEEKSLPLSGAGGFNLQIIPRAFFDLIETAKKLNGSIQNSHRYYLLGLAYECLNESNLAIIEFKKALMLDANDTDILCALGNAFAEMGNYHEAFLLLKKAFNYLPEEPELAHKLGEISFSIGEMEICIKALETAVSINPACSDYLVSLSRAYLTIKKTSEALELLHTAIKCDPESAKAHETLAIIHNEEGNHVLARKHALLAYDANPIDSDIANLLWQITNGSKK